MTLAPPNPPLHDEVVRLTPLAPEHVVPMRALGDDEDVARFTYVRAPLSDEAAQEWVGRYVAGWQDGSQAGFAIETQDDRAFLGFVGARPLRRGSTRGRDRVHRRARGPWPRRRGFGPSAC